MELCQLSKSWNPILNPRPSQVTIILVRFLLLLICILMSSHALGSYTVQQLLDSRFDPHKNYITLESQHFRIHYSADLEPLAKDLIPIAENVYVKVTRALKGEPSIKTNIVLIHHSDEPAIQTFVYPHNQIFLDASLPSPSVGLNEFAGWYDWVLTHEFTHIVHLDRRFGLYSALSPVFGSSIRPNEFTPLWVKEGLAVFNESTLTPKGRGESSLYRMMNRTAVAEGILNDSSFGAADTIASFDNKNWPWTVRPYFFGYYLMKTLQDGDNRNLVNIVNESACSLPFQVDGMLEAGSWGSFDALWNETITQMTRSAEAELNVLKQKPFTPLQYLTNTGQIYYGTAMSPSGNWLMVTRDHPDFENAILRFDLNGDDVSKPAVQVYRSTGYQTSFSRSGRFLAFDQTAKGGRHYLISDIYLYDLKSNDVTSVSPYFRARDPDIHPDGTHVVFVKNVGGKNRLVETDTGWGNPIDLLGDVGYRRISSPRFSPDGKRIVVCLHNEKTGGEDLWLVQGNSHQVLVENGAQNVQPSWTPDGEKILYASDRTGVFNIYAYDHKTHRSYQMSHVLGGLFYPVVDPKYKYIYVVSYRARGYDVARFQWKQATWIPVATNEESRMPAQADSGLKLQRQGTGVDISSPLISAASISTETKDYKSWKYLLPQYMRPAVIFRPNAYQLGIDFGAADPLFFQVYDVNVRYDSVTQLPVGEFTYFNGTKNNAWDVVATHDAVPINATSTSGGGIYRAFQAQWSLNLALSKEDTHLHWRPGVKYSIVGSSVPAFIGEASVSQYAGPKVGIRYSTEFKQVGHSFPESGSYLDVTAAENFGIDGIRTKVTTLEAEARTHFTLPWKRHAVHLEFEGGSFIYGDINAPNNFYTAGGRLSYPYTLGSSFTLYGFDPNTLESTGLGVGSFLYTLPISDIQRGLDTYPFYFGRLSLALRAQAAVGRDLGGLPWSYGAEIHQSLLLGFLYDMDFVVAAYSGSIQQGGTTQFFFMLSFNDSVGGGAKAPVAER